MGLADSSAAEDVPSSASKRQSRRQTPKPHMKQPSDKLPSSGRKAATSETTTQVPKADAIEIGPVLDVESTFKSPASTKRDSVLKAPLSKKKKPPASSDDVPMKDTQPEHGRVKRSSDRTASPLPAMPSSGGYAIGMSGYCNIHLFTRVLISNLIWSS